jgi:hypothetical protein
MLFAIFPFLVATVLYWVSCSELFAGPPDHVPSNWTSKLFLPVLTVSLAPLAAAADPDADHLPLLMLVTSLGILFSVLVAAGLRGDAAYFDLRLPVSTKARRFRRLVRWQLVCYVGAGLMALAGAASIIAVA